MGKASFALSSGSAFESGGRRRRRPGAMAAIEGVGSVFSVIGLRVEGERAQDLGFRVWGSSARLWVMRVKGFRV